ncbi:MAG: bifunctional phosphoribosylaminoimidazolecarboxamide formyltransferase/IMP cyclohydrolase [Alphaproteobacteria bacterium]|nr:bifunctional phosphoribosylaminoimidazolecarboxamide formyltransferase/IMP cyclohydrolase [Alphaproteobacteria bacterium]
MTARDRIPVRRALISVSDKTGLEAFGHFLAARGVEILSTGGTARQLGAAGVPVVEVSERTGFPEMLDGRVKTLHPALHGGLLGQRDDPAHVEAMDAHGIRPIDLLVVNLYPFAETVAAGADEEACIENIDIGGPALIRAAAKNHRFVAVATAPEHLDAIRAEMEADGATPLTLRRRLASEAYGHTAAYDAAVANWFAGRTGEPFPPRISLPGARRQTLRYGENPHQSAAFYTDGSGRPGVATAEQVQGRELSYNNLNDVDAAFELAGEFEHPAVVIVKHANPCGAAVSEDLVDAWEKALACDPVSAFGGIVAVNRPLDGALAERLAGLFLEAVIAPGADEAARTRLSVRTNLRLLLTGAVPDPLAPAMTFRSLAGGFLLQGRDNGRAEAFRTVTKRAPSEAEMADLKVAFTVCKHVKSNAIVYVKGGATVGVGAGQMSRVDSARIAARKAGDAAEGGEPATVGSVVASDAFFPFADGLLAAAEAGATAVVQPGGSVRDEEVIRAADERGLAMVFTGMRHFRH